MNEGKKGKQLCRVYVACLSLFTFYLRFLERIKGFGMINKLTYYQDGAFMGIHSFGKLIYL